MPLHVRALKYVVERTGAYLVPRAYKAFRQYDVRLTNQLFGKSGGKGFRHGRDAGLILSDFLGGDDLDRHAVQPPFNGTPSNRNYQTRNRYVGRSNPRRPVCYRPRRNKRYS